MVATAARTGTILTATQDLAAQDLINMAQVGAARASLKKGDTAKARAYAALVPDAFQALAYYSANSARQYNSVERAVSTASLYLGMHLTFQGLNDVRVPQPTVARRSLGNNLIFPPLKPSMYSGWTGIGAPQSIEVATHIRFASGLEARYIRVETDGPNAAMLTFVNERRATAGKPPVNLSAAALLREFRVQRAMDFYLTGQRLGDLRRYKEAGTDLFPSGKFPVGSDSYGSMHCFVVPLNQK